MILIIYIKDKTYHYDEEENLNVKEIADITDVSAVTVKILIYEAEDYISVINISAKDTSVISSLLNTFFDDSTFYFF